MTAKQEILQRLRATSAPEAELPELNDDWVQYEDIDAQFATMVAAVGGQCHLVDQWEQAREILAALPCVQQSGGLDSPHLRMVCLEPQLGLQPSVDLEKIDDPHDLENVDLAVIRGEFGVAENGAIWVTDENVRHRVIFFLPQHVAVVLPRDGLVNNLHEAYQRLTLQQHGGFGMFLSGPSKTADIEQSLVIGAHGARSLTVLRV